MMTGTGYARSRRDKEEESGEEVPAQKREVKVEKAKTRVETETLPKGPPPLAMVNTRHAGGMIERAARGFSLGELSASALSFERAKKWRVPLDIRRRTALDGNVTRLTGWLQAAKPKPEKPTAETVVKAEKPPEAKRPREEVKPVEVAQPKARRLRREEPKKEKPAKEPKKEKPAKEPKKVAPPKPPKKTKTKTKAKKE